MLTYLVIDEELNWVVAPLDEDNLIGLSRNPVRERGPDTRRGAGLEPHADGEGVHLGQALLHTAKQVVGPQGERQLEILRRPEAIVTCGEMSENCCFHTSGTTATAI